MALYGVLGDLHGNREALEAAIAELDRRGVERLLCVGDLIGYNADSDACVSILRERGATCILGNHDLIGTGRLGFERCSNKAMHALKTTRRTLSKSTVDFIASLPSHAVVEGKVLLTHGGVRDVQQYMTKPHHVVENAAYLSRDFPGVRVCFYGHTHEQRIFSVSNGTEVSEPFAREIAAGERVALPVDTMLFVNPGSVDASRKRESKQAELAVFDSAAMAITFHRTGYAHEATEQRAAREGYRIDRWRDRLYDVQRRVIGPRHLA